MNMQEALRVEELKCYGTSEGVAKAWETRGRGSSSLLDPSNRSNPYGGDADMVRELGKHFAQHPEVLQGDPSAPHRSPNIFVSRVRGASKRLKELLVKRKDRKNG